MDKIKKGKLPVIFGVVLSSLLAIGNIYAAANGNINQLTLPGGTITQAPNGELVINKDDKTPYCLNGCDVPLDCYGNSGLANSGYKWSCNKEESGTGIGTICKGTCEQVQN